jgi:hypothetical protein
MGSIVGDLMGIDDGSAARAQMAKQSAAIEKQEAATTAKESQLAQETQKRVIARRGGGQRMLLSQERPDAELGISSTLGG